MFLFEVLQESLSVRTEEKKNQGGYWMLQSRFVEHNWKRERKI